MSTSKHDDSSRLPNSQDTAHRLKDSKLGDDNDEEETRTEAVPPSERYETNSDSDLIARRRRPARSSLASGTENPSSVSEKHDLPPTVLTPFHLFVYGPSADSFFLTYSLHMPTNIEFDRASMHHYRVKLYRKYPALVPADGHTIAGNAIKISEQAQLDRIARWQGKHFKLVDCSVSLMRKTGSDYAPSSKDWTAPRWIPAGRVGGKVFVWAEDPESDKLQDGWWSEAWWLDLERPGVMNLKGETNNRELEAWEVSQRRVREVSKQELDARRFEEEGTESDGKLKGLGVEGAWS